jgi:hypothetical protein
MKINTSFFFKVFCLVTLVVVVGFYFLRGDAYLSLRIQGMLNGTDSSYNTRVVSSFDTLFRYYNQYGTIGCGFGNQTSDYGMSFFKLKDVNYRTCSTIAVFALEGGMIAGIVEVVFLIFCFKRVANHADGNRLRWALFSFVILYAFGGGYSTNPVLWMILGFAITDGMYYRIEEG